MISPTTARRLLPYLPIGRAWRPSLRTARLSRSRWRRGSLGRVPSAATAPPHGRLATPRVQHRSATGRWSIWTNAPLVPLHRASEQAERLALGCLRIRAEGGPSRDGNGRGIFEAALPERVRSGGSGLDETALYFYASLIPGSLIDWTSAVPADNPSSPHTVSMAVFTGPRPGAPAGVIAISKQPIRACRIVPSVHRPASALLLNAVRHVPHTPLRQLLPAAPRVVHARLRLRGAVRAAGTGFPLAVKTFVDRLLPGHDWRLIAACAGGLLAIYLVNTGLMAVVTYWGHVLGIAHRDGDAPPRLRPPAEALVLASTTTRRPAIWSRG